MISIQTVSIQVRYAFPKWARRERKSGYFVRVTIHRHEGDVEKHTITPPVIPR